jgi:hypothetical protein
MKPSIVIVLLIFTIYSCNNTNDDKIQSVDTLSNLDTQIVMKSDTIVKTDTEKFQNVKQKLDIPSEISLSKRILISSGQFSPYTSVKIDGFDFDLVTEGKDTVYLATTDKNFQTPDGYKVGTKFSDLPRRFQEVLTKEPGWAYYLKLTSGWTLGFCEGGSCTDHYPIADSKVKWIFKRR